MCAQLMLLHLPVGLLSSLTLHFSPIAALILQICRKLRAMFGATLVPIVMCTAMGEGSEALMKCREAGATDVLLKPFERGRMLEKVHQHCQEKVSTRLKRLAECASKDLHACAGMFGVLSTSFTSSTFIALDV